MTVMALVLSISATASFASGKVTTQRTQGTEDCTKSATVTATAEVECSDGSTVTIGAMVTEIATAATCEEATSVASIVASIKANASVKQMLKNFSC